VSCSVLFSPGFAFWGCGGVATMFGLERRVRRAAPPRAPKDRGRTLVKGFSCCAVSAVGL